MSKQLKIQDKEIRIKELFLNIFQEEGVSVEELKEAICKSYIDEGFNCKTFNDIPIKEMETSIIECYEAGGLAFENIDEVLEYFFKKED